MREAAPESSSSAASIVSPGSPPERQGSHVTRNAFVRLLVAGVQKFAALR